MSRTSAVDMSIQAVSPVSITLHSLPAHAGAGPASMTGR